MFRPSEARPLTKFFSLTYAISWVCFAAAAVATRGVGPSRSSLAILGGPLLLLGTIAPSLAALWLTERSGGRVGMHALLDRLFAWQTSARWYLFAVSYMAAIKIAVATVYRIFFGGWPAFGHEPWYILVAAVPFSAVAQAGEEIGWRGYALPRLAARFGFANGSIIVGFVWALWHLPLFYMPGLDKSGQSFPLFVVQLVALSVAMAWLYVHTNGSLLLTMLMHSAVNQSVGIVPSATAGATNPFALSHSAVGWLTAALAWASASYFLVRMPVAKELMSHEVAGRGVTT